MLLCPNRRHRRHGASDDRKTAASQNRKTAVIFSFNMQTEAYKRKRRASLKTLRVYGVTQLYFEAIYTLLEL